MKEFDNSYVKKNHDYDDDDDGDDECMLIYIYTRTWSTVQVFVGAFSDAEELLSYELKRGELVNEPW